MEFARLLKCTIAHCGSWIAPSFMVKLQSRTGKEWRTIAPGTSLFFGHRTAEDRENGTVSGWIRVGDIRRIDETGRLVRLPAPTTEGQTCLVVQDEDLSPVTRKVIATSLVSLNALCREEEERKRKKKEEELKLQKGEIEEASMSTVSSGSSENTQI